MNDCSNIKGLYLAKIITDNGIIKTEKLLIE